MFEVFIWEVILILLVTNIYLFLKNKKDIKEKQETIKNISNSKMPIIIWKVDVFSKKDSEILSKNKTLLKLLLKYISSEIAINTDKMRTWDNKDIWIGHINCLHKQYMFFDKLNKQEEKENENYSWQDLR